MAEPAPQQQQWPADTVERRSVASLLAYPRNARTHSEDQVRQIAASMREWGWTQPILIDEQNLIIAGHGRAQAAQSLGIETVPVMVARGWTETQKNAYRIADNQIPQNAGWDTTALRLELGTLKLAGFDMNLMAFGQVELVTFMSDPTKVKDPEAVVKPEPEPITRAGDVWLLGDHRLICGDATDSDVVETVLAGAHPKLMVTDPPYGVDYDPEWRNQRGLSSSPRTGAILNDQQADWRSVWEHYHGDVAYVWHASLHAHEVAAGLLACKFDLRSQIIWVKQQIVIGRGDYHWQHEPCWYAVRHGKSGHYVGDRKQRSVWEINNQMAQQNGPEDAATVHGTQKPVECMRRPIANNSVEGDTVYDPFVGSGTTIIAGEMTRRRVLAIDLDPIYCDVAVRRWQSFTDKHALLELDGRAFAEVAAERLKPTSRRRAAAPGATNGKTSTSPAASGT